MIEGPLRRPALVTALMLVTAIAWMVWSEISANAKMAGLRPGSSVDVQVVLRFAPEAFHLTRAQQVGQLVRADGVRLYLRRADRALLHDYARARWVVEVKDWNAQ